MLAQLCDGDVAVDGGRFSLSDGPPRLLTFSTFFGDLIWPQDLWGVPRTSAFWLKCWVGLSSITMSPQRSTFPDHYVAGPRAESVGGPVPSCWWRLLPSRNTSSVKTWVWSLTLLTCNTLIRIIHSFLGVFFFPSVVLLFFLFCQLWEKERKKKHSSLFCFLKTDCGMTFTWNSKPPVHRAHLMSACCDNLISSSAPSCLGTRWLV